jgi:hypothetical protein
VIAVAFSQHSAVSLQHRWNRGLPGYRQGYQQLLQNGMEMKNEIILAENNLQIMSHMNDLISSGSMMEDTGLYGSASTFVSKRSWKKLHDMMSSCSGMVNSGAPAKSLTNARDTNAMKRKINYAKKLMQK